MSYLDLPLSQIHISLVQKKVTPLDLTQEALTRAKASQDNAFEYIAENEALAFASALLEPEEDNLLWGIPYAAKDNLSTKGIPTTASSNSLNGYVPSFDATVIARLKEKKAVLIGKTTLDELAMGGSGTTGHKGATFNPYDQSHQRMIGGSSCGSAAVVASGIVPFALGSDTGDSIRKPAGYSGIIGVKPTWGRISRFGLFPFAPSMDHVGYFTRHAEDLPILFEALAGPDPKDLTCSSLPVQNFDGDKTFRIIVLDDVMASLPSGVIRDAFEGSLEKLEVRGCEIVHLEFGLDLLKAIYPTYIILSSAEASSNDANIDGLKFGPYHAGESYQEAMAKARSNGFSELIRRRFAIGSFALSEENRETMFVRAQRIRSMIVERVNEVLQKGDFIYLPTASSIAPLFSDALERLPKDPLPVNHHLILGNFAGLPSINMPLGYERGMPFGATLMGHAFQEGPLFAACSLLEDITGLGGAYFGEKD
ncbi:MAG: aspartyl/glutamyl-tRNA amidotransferase subunit A [Bacilli bacterium]|nr:aspartyl/glutamyl-tRNA amidotransferase subunit A [Bacilli bacterium]